MRATISEDGASLDKLGGVAWQSRKARMKERIREIAGDRLAIFVGMDDESRNSLEAFLKKATT